MMPRARNILDRTKVAFAKLTKEVQEGGFPKMTADEAWDECASDPSVRKICDDVKLVSNNPRHLAELLKALAGVHVGRKGGAPTVWDTFRWAQLLADYLRTRIDHPKAKDADIFNMLIKTRRQYRQYNPDTLARQFNNAIKSDKNKLLRHQLASFDEQLHPANKHRRRRPLPDWQAMPDHWNELKK
jgi:hypothetical protein